MPEKRVSEMTASELRSAIQYGVFTGMLGISALGAILMFVIAVLSHAGAR